MQSLRYLYKIGHGPSSSHTMGPNLASKEMLRRYPMANNFKVTLYGSLALTGKGHLTDKVIKDTFSPLPCVIKFDYVTRCYHHPNTLDISAYKDDELLKTVRFYSIGGGSIEVEGEGRYVEEDIYPEKDFNAVKEYLLKNHLTIPEYVIKVEGESIKPYLKTCYEAMKDAIKRGLNTEGVLPGELKVPRKAKEIFNNSVNDLSMNFTRKIFAYAFAAAEENASGNIVVTAPTCGASGLLPAVLYGLQKEYNLSEDKILEAMMVAGLIGNIVKNNASISGAEAGCQAEVGTACSMAAAATTYLLNGTIDEIEQAAEIALEHHLGLTCDPILGYVQIPCIERNAVCALRAIDSAKLVKFIEPNDSKISFDVIVKTMIETGKDINKKYRETSEGGLAKEYEGKEK